MDKKRLLATLAISWPLVVPAYAVAGAAHTTLGAHSCAALPEVPDQDTALTLCAQVARSGDRLALIATGPAGATCLARVLYVSGQHQARLAPDGEQLRAIGADGRLYWRWSAAANARYGNTVDAFIACGRAASTASDEREVLFTVPGSAP